MTPEQATRYFDDKCDIVLNRVYSMEQYMTTEDAREAIKRQLRKVYQDGRNDGIRAEPVRKRFLTLKPDAK